MSASALGSQCQAGHRAESRTSRRRQRCRPNPQRRHRGAGRGVRRRPAPRRRRAREVLRGNVFRRPSAWPRVTARSASDWPSSPMAAAPVCWRPTGSTKSTELGTLSPDSASALQKAQLLPQASLVDLSTCRKTPALGITRLPSGPANRRHRHRWPSGHHSQDGPTRSRGRQLWRPQIGFVQALLTCWMGDAAVVAARGVLKTPIFRASARPKPLWAPLAA